MHRVNKDNLKDWLACFFFVLWISRISHSVYGFGSSIIRHVRVNGVSGSATVACFPGARVLDIARR